ncbi:ComF family protein [Lysobacter sp. CW239]|uniref:ComF family protein n=1 Tax=Lysobacteraceae TaxID=32033 RepID=UPI0012EB8D48|nr:MULTISPECIES: ComF family protein [Lysobacter]QOD91154.1 ComF family protein [Lysobacter sp. CW239]
MTAPVNQTTPQKVDSRCGRFVTWLRHDAIRLLWPGRCLACAAPGENGRDLCAACRAALPWHGPACERCALPLPAPNPAETALCGTCLQRPPPLAQTHAACTYRAPLDRLLPRFKFHHDLAAGRLLSQMMVEAFSPLSRPDALIPIPLHRARLRRRGYDQALELARPLADALAIPLLDDALLRPRATAPQSRLDAAGRQRNLRGAFTVRPGADLPAHVVLVDDVMTTGATLHAAAIVLRRAGAARVDAWVAARVP